VAFVAQAAPAADPQTVPPPRLPVQFQQPMGRSNTYGPCWYARTWEGVVHGGAAARMSGGHDAEPTQVGSASQAAQTAAVTGATAPGAAAKHPKRVSPDLAHTRSY